MLLPVGLVWEDQVHREAELGPITGMVRRELLSLQGRGEAYKAYRHVLKLTLARLGTLPKIQDQHILAMPYADAEYLIAEVVRHIYGDKPFKTQAYCANCNDRFPYEVDWDELTVCMVEDTPFKNDNTMPFAVPGPKGRKGAWKLPTVNDMERALRATPVSAERQQQDVVIDFGKVEQALLFVSIKYLEGFEQFTMADLDRLDLREYNYLLHELYVEMRHHEPGVKMPDRECTGCGSPVAVRVNWLSDFLLRLTA